MKIKYKVMKREDVFGSIKSTIVSEHEHVYAAAKSLFMQPTNSQHCYHEIIVECEKLEYIVKESQMAFAELYKRVASGEALVLDAWTNEKLWIDKDGYLIAGDYFMNQSNIIDCLEWCEVIG